LSEFGDGSREGDVAAGPPQQTGSRQKISTGVESCQKKDREGGETSKPRGKKGKTEIAHRIANLEERDTRSPVISEGRPTAVALVLQGENFWSELIYWKTTDKWTPMSLLGSIWKGVPQRGDRPPRAI